MAETAVPPPQSPSADDSKQIAAGPIAPFIILFRTVIILFRTVAGIPSDKLILMALLAAFGAVLYAVGWVIPAVHRETIGIITNSAEQERELDRKAKREESDTERRERREQNEKLRTTIREENEKTRETHSRDTEKLRTEFRMGIEEIKRTKSGGGFAPLREDDIIGPPPRLKGAAKDE